MAPAEAIDAIAAFRCAEQLQIAPVEIGPAVAALDDVVEDQLDGRAVAFSGLAATLASTTALSDDRGPEVSPFGGLIERLGLLRGRAEPRKRRGL
jgi:hypothetical protein